MKRVKKQPAVPPAKPREPLTAKRKAAIHAYVRHKGKEAPFLFIAVEDTLKAERMKAESLYQWLESKGYRWESRAKVWRES
jgi:hypothetical protein